MKINFSRIVQPVENFSHARLPNFSLLCIIYTHQNGVTGNDRGHLEPNYCSVSKTRANSRVDCEDMTFFINIYLKEWRKSTFSFKVVMKGEGLPFSNLLIKVFYTEKEKYRAGVF